MITKEFKKYGKWKNITGAIKINEEIIPLVQCSTCTTLFHLKNHPNIMSYKYCPNCGVKMKL